MTRIFIPPDKPAIQAVKPPVRAHHVLLMNPGDVANLHDLSAHAGLDYRILSLMPANDVIVRFALT